MAPPQHLARSWPPGRRDVLVSRRSALGATLGATLLATLPGGGAASAPVPATPREASRVEHDRVALREEFRRLVPCGSRTVHVSGTGSDQGTGSEDDPLREIRTAVRRARPGDLVLVGAGTYGYTEVRDYQGRPDAWLGIMTADDEVEAVVHVPPPTDNFVNVIGSSYVGIFGLEVRGVQENPNTNGSGISVYGGSHHVRVWANHVHDFPGGGVNCFDVDGSHDCVDISHNVIHGTSRYSPWNTSGISIHASRDLTAGATLEEGYGYRVVGNYVYDVECLVPFTPGGFEVVTDGNAVSLDLVAATHGYRKPILVADNVLVGCGGRAVHAYGTVNVDVRGNIAVGNMRSRSPLIVGAELNGTTDASIRFTDNVVCPLETDDTTDGTSSYSGNVLLGGRQAVPPGNVDARDRGLTWFSGPVSRETLRSGLPVASFAPLSGPSCRP